MDNVSGWEVVEVHRPVSFRPVEYGSAGGAGGGGAAERKSRGNMEVENITNKHNVWTEIGDYGS